MAVQRLPTLTLESVNVRAILVPLRRPIVAKVGTFADWPILLIDLHTKEGVVGKAYLEPYVKSAVGYLAAAIHDLADRMKGKPLAPFDAFRDALGALHLIGR